MFYYLKNLKLIDWIVILLFFIVLLSSIFYFRTARNWVGKEFSGVLVFENNVVGAFNQFEWESTKKGLRYHDTIVDEIELETYEVIQDGQSQVVSLEKRIFNLGDFLKVFCIPFFSGFLFLFFGITLYSVMRGTKGALPFYLFHCAVSFYLISSFNFQSDHHLSWLFLLVFCFMPAFMTNFAFVFPETPSAIQKRPFLLTIPYLLSLLLAIPYVITFYKQPLYWPRYEAAVIGYAFLSYLLWLTRLVQITQQPQQETGRLTAKYLLVGQFLAFTLPVIFTVQIFVFKWNVPLNWAAPANLIFPIAALFGMTLAKLKRTQMDLIQSEKMASLGQLLAGVAHEINNPTTFIYSNLSPLKSYLSYIKENMNPNASKYREEMSVQEVIEDLICLVDNIEEGATRTKEIVSDLRRFGHSQDEVVSDVQVLEGIQGTLNILKHEWFGRIQVHINVPQDLTMRGNSGQLSQVWMNLLSNAIQSIEGQGDIWIRGWFEKKQMILSIKDSGCGIKKSHLHKIFDPFFTTKLVARGTGLGLSIVQKIVKKWNGRIEVKSEVGKGTEIVLSF